MSANILAHSVQEFSTISELLLQQRGSRLRDAVRNGKHVGTQAVVVNQFDALEMAQVVSKFTPINRSDVAVDRRWVFPIDFSLAQMIDSFDKLRLISDPQSSEVEVAVNAAARKIDATIVSAFFAIAKTGQTGSVNTIYPAANTIGVGVGGANSKLNVEKLREVRRLMMRNQVDLDKEKLYIAITGDDHDAMLGSIHATSKDFNGGMPVLKDGRIDMFMGFNFIHCQMVETLLAGVAKVTLPVWVQSGVHLGVWNDLTTDVDRRKDLSSLPVQIYTNLTIGATRVQENKVYGIDSFRP